MLVLDVLLDKYSVVFPSSSYSHDSPLWGKTEVAAAIVSGHGSGHDTNVVPGESIVCGSVSCYMADITSMTKHSTTMVS